MYSAFRAGACAKAQRHCAAGGSRGNRGASQKLSISQQVVIVPAHLSEHVYEHEQVVIVPAHVYEHAYEYKHEHEYAYGDLHRPFEQYPFKLPLAW